MEKERRILASMEGGRRGAECKLLARDDDDESSAEAAGGDDFYPRFLRIFERVLVYRRACRCLVVR